MATDAPSERTQVHRLPERGVYDREAIDAILDEALICHVGHIVDGQPRVIPRSMLASATRCTSTARTPADAPAARSGTEICVEVTLIDGLVLARSAFHHSMNYRSVVVYGKARPVTDAEEKFAAQRALVDHVVHGRSDDARMPNERELNQTTILAIGLDEASAKVRTGPPKDEPEDYELDGVGGRRAIAPQAGRPDPDPQLSSGIEPPPYATEYRR